MFKLLEGKDNQETFDIVVARLRKQGKPAYNDAIDACIYRTEDEDCKCAIGLLFPEDAPDSAYKFTGTVEDLFHQAVIEAPSDIAFLRALQHAHDDPKLNANNVSDLTWQRECSMQLMSVAETYKLNGKSAEEWHNSLASLTAPCKYWWKGIYNLRYYCIPSGDIIPKHWHRECQSACNKPNIPIR